MTHADSSTLDGVRYILTKKNKSNRPLTSGPLERDTEVICLRRSDSGYYIPCLAYVVAVYPSGRVALDLYWDRSERVNVSRKAILWPDTEQEKRGRA